MRAEGSFDGSPPQISRHEHEHGERCKGDERQKGEPAPRTSRGLRRRAHLCLVLGPPARGFERARRLIEMGAETAIVEYVTDPIIASDDRRGDGIGGDDEADMRV